MIITLSKIATSLFMAMGLHSGSVAHVHYFIVNNQVPKISSVNIEEHKIHSPAVQTKEKTLAQKPQINKPAAKPVVYTPKKSAAVSKPSSSHIVMMSVSAYTYSGGVGNGHFTASGEPVHVGIVAAGPAYPFGTKLLINGQLYVVKDRGSAIDNQSLDVFMPTEQQCIQFGRQYLPITILD